MILLNTIYVLSSLSDFFSSSSFFLFFLFLLLPSPPLHSLSPPLSLAYPPPKQDALSGWYPPLCAPRSGPEPVFVLLPSPKYWVSRLALPHVNYVVLYFKTKASCNSGNDWTASVALSSIFPWGRGISKGFYCYEKSTMTTETLKGKHPWLKFPWKCYRGAMVEFLVSACSLSKFKVLISFFNHEFGLMILLVSVQSC